MIKCKICEKAKKHINDNKQKVCDIKNKMCKTCKIKKYINKITYSIDIVGEKLAKLGISANLITLTGFIIGISAINFISLEMYGYALIAILTNRLFDALDGAVARANGITNFGIFFDATLDYIFYAGVIFGFAWANPDKNALSACFLLLAFISSAVSILAYAVIAYKNEEKLEINKSPFYLGGFAQGFETLIALVLFCIVPNLFTPIAIVFGILCLIKALSTIATAYYNFTIQVKNEK